MSKEAAQETLTPTERGRVQAFNRSLKHLLPFPLLAILAGGLGWNCAPRIHPITEGSHPSEWVDTLSQRAAMDHLITGAFAEESGDLYQSATEYGMALLYDPTSVEVALALSRVYAKMGEVEASVRVLMNALRYHPQHPQLMEMLASRYARQGRFSEASSYLLQLERLGSFNLEQTLRLSGLLEQLGLLSEAKGVCQRALTRFGEKSQIYERLGWIAVRVENYQEAEENFNRALGLDPNNHQLLFMMGNLGMIRQEPDRAIPYFRRAVQIKNDEVKYWVALLEALAVKKNWNELDSAAESAIHFIPNEASFWFFRGRVSEEQGDWKRALMFYDSALTRDSTLIEAYLRKGYHHHQEEDWAKAGEAYEKALSYDPDNPVVLNNFAYMLAVSGRELERALEMVEKALEVDPDNPSFIDTRGWILYRLGRWEEALKEVKRALELSEEDNSELYEHLGAIYEALGQKEQAREAYQRAIDLDPNNLRCQEALKRLNGR